MGGAEVEGVIVATTTGVLHVRLAKPKMEKVVGRAAAEAEQRPTHEGPMMTRD